MSCTQPGIEKDSSSIVLLYELRNPLDVGRNINEQVYALMFNAHLVDHSSQECAVIAGRCAESLSGLSINNTLQHIRVSQSDKSASLASFSMMSRCAKAQLTRFVNNGYILENVLAPWAQPHSNRGGSLSYYGMCKNRELTHITVIYQAESYSSIQQQLAFIQNNSTAMFVIDVVKPMDIGIPIHRQVQWLAEHSCVRECNNAAAGLFGFRTKSGAFGRRLLGRTVKFDFATQAKEFILNDYKLKESLIKISSQTSADQWLSTSATGVVSDGKLTQVLCMAGDVTERISYSQEVEFRARHDDLTGLANRRHFIDQVGQALALGQYSSAHALFLLDLDGFKEINDTLGHETGDRLLYKIGPRISEVFMHHEALVSRLGGDEFAVFIQNFSGRQSILTLADSLMQAVKAPFSINKLDLSIGGSVGIAFYPDDGNCVSSLMRCADVAMYQAKQTTADYCLYNFDRDHHSVRRLSLMMDIRHSIANNELLLHYQPIVDLTNSQVLGFEVLIRWQHPEHGLLSPGEFIPLVELTDMIKPVTWWVIETAIKQLSDWNQCDWPYRLAVNISTRNLVDSGFVNFIANCLRRHGVDGSRLELEITESTLMADPDKARNILLALSKLGIAISIDDYGTGYSSLAYLKSLPITTLKIDRAFISQMAESNQDRIIVHSTVQLAHNLGLQVTAEGIEDPVLVKVLKELGCDKGQGFHICRPVALSQLNHWLEQHEHSQTFNQSI